MKKCPTSDPDRDRNLSSPFRYSACSDGGTSYACLDTSAFTENGVRYGFVALSLDITGGPSSCCECYEATFLEGPMKDETMIVQVTGVLSAFTTRGGRENSLPLSFILSEKTSKWSRDAVQ